MIGDGDPIDIQFARTPDELPRCLMGVVGEAGVRVEICANCGLWTGRHLGALRGPKFLRYRINRRNPERPPLSHAPRQRWLESIRLRGWGRAGKSTDHRAVSASVAQRYITGALP